MAGCDGREIVVREVLAARRQLVVHELGQHLLQLHEEPFARRIAVGVHVKRNPLQTSPRGGFLILPLGGVGGGFLGGAGEGLVQRAEQLHVVALQQRGRGDGDGLVTSRDHRPAVGAALRDPELVARLQEVQHGQVVDSALRPAGEAEAGRGNPLQTSPRGGFLTRPLGGAGGGS